MKKQLFLLLLVLAFIAGISNGYAQCIPDALHPAAGIEYTYSATIGGPGYTGNNSSMWDWYITKDVNLLTGVILVPPTMFSVNATTPYHNAATGANQILLTWTAAAVSDGGPFYLVLRYRENNSTANP
ncbi:MAG TPA: hypothetical protein VIJ25_05330, partial [Methylococcales bacterium]